jgi:hypothetical protein
MAESGRKADRQGLGRGSSAGRGAVYLTNTWLFSGYDERAIPIQKAAISSADSASNTRIRFFRTAKMTTAMAQSRKPSSGQNNPEPPPPHPPDASCIKNEADEVAAVRRAPSAPASATPLAQFGSTQFFRASRQSSQVCATTTPTIIKTNSATFPLLSANRFGYRTCRAASPCWGERESSYDCQNGRGPLPSNPLSKPRILCGSVASTDPVALPSKHFDALPLLSTAYSVLRKSSAFSRVHYTKFLQHRKLGFAKLMRAIGLPKDHMVSLIGGISILLQGDEIQHHTE